MRRAVAASLIGLALLTGTTAASAEVHIITFKGTIDSGFDEGNEFGLSGGSLAGLSYSQSFTYDSSLGDRFTTSSYDYLRRNVLTGVTPILNASLTINGITQNFGGASNSTLSFGLFVLPGGGSAAAAITVIAQQTQYGPSADRITSSIGTTFFNAPGPFSLTTDFSAPIPSTGDSGIANSFSLRTDPYGGTPTETYGFTNPTSILISSPGSSGGPQPSAVPEPASWAFLVAGFGVVGATARRRRATHRKLAAVA